MVLSLEKIVDFIYLNKTRNHLDIEGKTDSKVKTSILSFKHKLQILKK